MQRNFIFLFLLSLSGGLAQASKKATLLELLDDPDLQNDPDVLAKRKADFIHFLDDKDVLAKLRADFIHFLDDKDAVAKRRADFIHFLDDKDAVAKISGLKGTATARRLEENGECFTSYTQGESCIIENKYGASGQLRLQGAPAPTSEPSSAPSGSPTVAPSVSPRDVRPTLKAATDCGNCGLSGDGHTATGGSHQIGGGWYLDGNVCSGKYYVEYEFRGPQWGDSHVVGIIKWDSKEMFDRNHCRCEDGTCHTAFTNQDKETWQYSSASSSQQVVGGRNDLCTDPTQTRVWPTRNSPKYNTRVSLKINFDDDLVTVCHYSVCKVASGHLAALGCADTDKPGCTIGWTNWDGNVFSMVQISSYDERPAGYTLGFGRECAPS